jgi:DNA-directed RNA polymerase subunit RPC12/RpoP
MTETKKKPVYWICDECGCEVPFSGNDSDTVCPSCGSRISSEKLTQVRRELNNANTPQSMIRNESSASVISDNDHRKYIYEDLVRLLNAILNSKLSAGKHPLPDYEVPKKEPDLMIQDGCLVRYNGSKNRVEIPSTVTSINPYAFSGCKTIREVVIPNEVKVIPRYAF